MYQHRSPHTRAQAKALVAAAFAASNHEPLPPSNRGRNARGLALHRPTKGAKHAKRQHVGGNQPTLAATRWGWV
jgi:hypothetical protein